jgi:hypothetical protein
MRFGNGKIDRDKEIGATRQQCQDTYTNIKRFGDGRINKAWVYGLKMNWIVDGTLNLLLEPLIELEHVIPTLLEPNLDCTSSFNPRLFTQLDHCQKKSQHKSQFS